jgi:hypothetical protein
MKEKYFQTQFEKYIPEKSKDSQELFLEAFNKYLWRPWKYNQIIGFIELFVWENISAESTIVLTPKEFQFIKRQNILRILERHLKWEYILKKSLIIFSEPC